MPDEKKPDCEHAKVEIVGGSGELGRLWDTFRCPACGWTFDLEHIDK